MKTYEVLIYQLTKEIKDIEQQRDQLEDRIYEAIKQLEKAYTRIDMNNNVNYIHEAFKEDLLNILKGDD